MKGSSSGTWKAESWAAFKTGGNLGPAKTSWPAPSHPPHPPSPAAPWALGLLTDRTLRSCLEVPDAPWGCLLFSCDVVTVIEGCYGNKASPEATVGQPGVHSGYWLQLLLFGCLFKNRYYLTQASPLFTVIHGKALSNRLRLLGPIILWHDSSESS